MRLILKVVQIISWFLGIILIGAIAFVIWLRASNFDPPISTKVPVKGNANKPFPESNEITLLTWNIGYCGLGKEMDFFYDGGSQTRCSIDQYQQNLNGVFNFLSSNSNLDFCLIQEVDLDSKRSYYTQQEQLFRKAFNKCNSLLAENYKVPFVPFPLLDPMGKVHSGIMTFTPYSLNENLRLGFEVNFGWPKNLFMLKRCMLLSRKTLSNGKDLVVINIHNSAFDEDGKLRSGELKTLKTLLLEEYAKGNFVIAGGDWNQNPPGFRENTFSNGDVAEIIYPELASDFMPKSWKYLSDPKCPTNRFLDISYTKGQTKTTIIDYFLVSPNIESIITKTIPLGFEVSDHNPVLVKVRLADDPYKLQIREDSLKIQFLQDSIQILLHKKIGRKPIGK